MENATIHYKVMVRGQNFKVYWNNALAIEANALLYQGGKIGFTLYGQDNTYFDNIRIEAIPPAVANQNDRFTMPLR
ncbi:TPA: hypothetical protein ENS27_14465 [bacterium]|nr:hypothetical protein [bacterium]